MNDSEYRGFAVVNISCQLVMFDPMIKCPRLGTRNKYIKRKHLQVIIRVPSCLIVRQLCK